MFSRCSLSDRYESTNVYDAVESGELRGSFFFFLNDRPPTEISPLPQPAALPISAGGTARAVAIGDRGLPARPRGRRLREDPGGARHRRGPPLLDVPAGAEVVARR